MPLESGYFRICTLEGEGMGGGGMWRGWWCEEVGGGDGFVDLEGDREYERGLKG